MTSIVWTELRAERQIGNALYEPVSVLVEIGHSWRGRVSAGYRAAGGSTLSMILLGGNHAVVPRRALICLCCGPFWRWSVDRALGKRCSRVMTALRRLLAS